jgi:hypothetical protein
MRAVLFLAAGMCMTLLVAASAFGDEGVAHRPEAAEGGAPVEFAPAPHGDRVVVTYFHRTLRCQTCLGMEAAAREAVFGDFLDRVSAGTLEWRAVNFDLPLDAHFEEEFDLEGSSLVFAELGGEKIVRWEKIDGIWNHAGNPEELRPFVVRELRRFLAHGTAEGQSAAVEAGEAAMVPSSDSSAGDESTP